MAAGSLQKGSPNPYPDSSRPLEDILAPLKTNTRDGYALRNPARQSRRAERIE
jgi:hypothetical protein